MLSGRWQRVFDSLYNSGRLGQGAYYIDGRSFCGSESGLACPSLIWLGSQGYCYSALVMCIFLVPVSHQTLNNVYLYSDCLRRESNFLASTRRVTALCMHVCCIVWLWDCIMVIRKPTCKKCNIRTRTRQWPDALKQKSYSLVEGSNYRNTLVQRVMGNEAKQLMC